MLVTTGNEFAGYAITAYLGIVRGIVVRSPNIAQNLLGGLKSIIGGNIESYANVCESAREEAFERMSRHAEEHGANGVEKRSLHAGALSGRAALTAATTAATSTLARHGGSCR